MKTFTNANFLQSREWEEFQVWVGRKTWRINGLLIIKLPLALGKSYLYCAGAPNKDLIDESSALARKENAIFFKMEPMSEDVSTRDNLLNTGFRKSKKEVQPQKTIVLNITKSEEELLTTMHSKTRYNIRLAGKHSIQFSNNLQGSNPQKFEEFWMLLQKTSERDAFHTHFKDYYQKLLAMPLTKLFGVEYKDKLVAASIVLFYGDKAYYLHGASDYEYRSLMAPYLLHWETIKYAKANSFKEYDLWGIDKARWPGVTRFKRGFGGREVEYIGSYDYVFQPVWYRAYNLQGILKSKVQSTA